jgi:hypothetical protein
LDGFLADTDRSSLAYWRLGSRAGRADFLRFGATGTSWIGLFKVAFFDLIAGVSDAPTRFSAGRRGGSSFTGAAYGMVFVLLYRVN